MRKNRRAARCEEKRGRIGGRRKGGAVYSKERKSAKEEGSIQKMSAGRRLLCCSAMVGCENSWNVKDRIVRL